MVDKRFAVIGLGQFGLAIARELAGRGAEVLAIDNNEQHIEEIKDDVAFAVQMDATDKKALAAQNIQDMDAVIVAIGDDFEALLLCTVYCLELNSNRVVSRANGEHQRKILEKIGVTDILSPEFEVGKIVAERLLNPSLVSFIQLPDDYEIAEIKTPRNIAGLTIGDLNLRSKYRLSLITLKREFRTKKGDETMVEVHIVGVPDSDTIIMENDTIIVFGTTKDVKRFIEINQ